MALFKGYLGGWVTYRVMLVGGVCMWPFVNRDTTQER